MLDSYLNYLLVCINFDNLYILKNRSILYGMKYVNMKLLVIYPFNV